MNNYHPILLLVSHEFWNEKTKNTFLDQVTKTRPRGRIDAKKKKQRKKKKASKKNHRLRRRNQRRESEALDLFLDWP